MTQSPSPALSRLERLRGFLAADPDNISLLEAAATEAFDLGELDLAAGFLADHARVAQVPDALANLSGLIALRQGRFGDANSLFSALDAKNPHDPVIRLNLAWARSGLGDHAGVLEALDDETAAASVQAAVLKVRALHHLEQLDEALACGAALAQIYPNQPELMGALALVAIDSGDMGLAELYSARAGDQVDGLSTRGFLSLAGQNTADALDMFDRALSRSNHDPRALLGKGLGLLLTSENASAAGYFDRAAQGFGTHLGSWVAAGWAYMVKGDLATSRERFEKAVAIDGTFAEPHGALAVLDLIEGRTDSAKRRMETALRLDRQCLSAALAKTLLLASQGDVRRAQAVRDKAMALPVGPGGQTLAQAIAAMAAVSGLSGGTRR